MAKERNALKAGIFIIVTIVLIISITIGIKGMSRWIEPRQTRTVRFSLGDDVGGLRPGDEVRVGGVKRGEIRDIELAGLETPAADDDQILITISIPRQIVLRAGTSVRVQSTLTGVSWLNIDSLGTGEALATEVALNGKPGAMNQLFASAGDLVPELQATVNDIRNVTIPKVNTAVERATETADRFRETGAAATDLVNDVKGRVEPLFEKYLGVGDRISEVMIQARDILGDGKGDIRGLLANINAFTAEIRQKLPGLLEQAETAMANVNSAVEKANATMDDLQTTASNFKELSTSARSVMATNRGRIDQIVDSLNATSNNLKVASVEIRHSPWRLLYKPKKGEVANLNLYDSTRQFAEGANELNDAAVALRDALKDPNLSEEQIQSMVEKLDKTFSNFKEVEAELWKRVQD